MLIDDPVTGPPGDLFVTPHGQEGSIALSSIHGRENCAVGVLAAHFARITAVVYRTKYQQLISAGAEGLLNVWTPKSLINAICDEDNGEEDIPWRRKKKHKSHHKYNASRDQNSDSSETNQPSLVPTESNTEYLPPIIRSYLEDVQRQNMVATFSVSSSSGST